METKCYKKTNTQEYICRYQSIKTDSSSHTDLVVSFSDSAKFPIEVDRVFLANDLVGDTTRFGITQCVRVARLPFSHHVALGPFADGKRLDLGKDGLAECHQIGLGGPCLGVTRIEERADARGGDSKDEGVVPPIDVGIEQGGGLGVRACHDDGVGSHDISGQTSRDEPITVFLRRDQNFATLR